MHDTVGWSMINCLAYKYWCLTYISLFSFSVFIVLSDINLWYKVCFTIIYLIISNFILFFNSSNVYNNENNLDLISDNYTLNNKV